MKWEFKIETLKKWTEVAKIFALVAVPIIVALGPLILQNRLAQQSMQKDYVTLAIGILAKPKAEQPDTELRKWAVEIVNQNSPVPISPGLKEKLGLGGTNLSLILPNAAYDWSEVRQAWDKAKKPEEPPKPQ
jgi:hypothetical protein